MTHATRFVAVLVALAAGTPVQGQTPEIDALRARAEAGVTEAQYDLAASQLCCQMLQRAIENRYRIGGLMNSTQVAEARRLAREWDAAHPREP